MDAAQAAEFAMARRTAMGFNEPNFTNAHAAATRAAKG